MSLKAAHRAARKGDMARAIRIVRENLDRQPGNPNVHRALALFLKRHEGDEAYVGALQNWAMCGPLSGRYEALDLIRRELGLTTRLKSKMQMLVTEARMRRIRFLLEHRPSLISDRISLHLYLGELEKTKELIFALPVGKRHGAIKATLTNIQRDLQVAGEGDVLLDIYDSTIPTLTSRPLVLLGLAWDLLSAKRLDDLDIVLPLVDEVEDLAIDAAELRFTLAERHGTPKGAEAARARWHAMLEADDVEPAFMARFVLATSDTGMAQRIVARAEWGKITSQQACDMIDRQFTDGENETAFALSVAAGENWPDLPALVERSNMLAGTAAEEELAGYQRKRELLRREIGPDLAALIGTEPLEERGGRNYIHRIIRDAVADAADPSGLLDLAQLCLSSFRIVTSNRSGGRREARELHLHGAANWTDNATEAERLARLVRAIVATAASVDPDHPALYDTLLELQAIELADTALAASLVDTMLDILKSGQIPRIDALLGKIALSCSDSALHQRFIRWYGMPLKVMPFRSVTKTDLPMLQPGATETQAIRVIGPRFAGQIDLSFPIDAVSFSAPRKATVHAGYLISLDENSVLDIADGRRVPRAEAPVRFTGTLAVGLEQACTTIEPAYNCDELVILIPAGRVHFRNYFHFTGQLLPRLLMLLESADRAGPLAKIGIPEFAEGFVDNMLSIAGVNPDRILRLPDRTGRFSRALVSSPVVDDTQCSGREISLARSQLGNGRCVVPDGPKYFLQRSIASARNLGRSLTNVQDLAATAEKFGYQAVDPGMMSQSDQRDMFRNAAAICGATGAAFANMLYLPGGAQVTCFSPHETCRTYFPGLTLGQNLHFTWVLGTFDPDLVNSQRYPHRPFSVEPSHLEQALSG